MKKFITILKINFNYWKFGSDIFQRALSIYRSFVQIGVVKLDWFAFVSMYVSESKNYSIDWLRLMIDSIILSSKIWRKFEYMCLEPSYLESWQSKFFMNVKMWCGIDQLLTSMQVSSSLLYLPKVSTLWYMVTFETTKNDGKWNPAYGMKSDLSCEIRTLS